MAIRCLDGRRIANGQMWGDMDFEINGQNYILTFLPNEGSFGLFEKDDDGVHRMKIVHDDGPMFIAPLDGTEKNEGKRSLN
jgi:hypothetical protein